jgi:hypothetical protein
MMAKRGRPKGSKNKKAPTTDAPVKRHTRKVKASRIVEPENLGDLGPIVLPEADQALRVLRELGELNDDALAAHSVYLEAKQAMADAKEHWEALANEVQERLRLVTHGTPDLPLVDLAEREERIERMIEGTIDVQPVEGSENGQGTAPATPGDANAPAAEGQAPDSEFPF